MIEPYTAVGLIPTFWGARRRADIAKNLEHLGRQVALMQERGIWKAPGN
jgi:hypothetical protein